MDKVFRFLAGSRFTPPTENTALPSAEQRSVAFSDTPGIMRLFNICDTGVNVTSNTVESLTHLFRGLAIRANMAATMPQNVYEKTGKSSTIAAAHPIQTLLATLPNDEYTPFDFKWMLEYTALLYGGGGAEIIRDPRTGRPMSLRLFRTGCSQYKLNPNDPLRYYENETMRLYDAADIIYIPGVVVTNGARQMSLAQMFKETFGEALATQMLVNHFMKNAPHLSAVYTYTGPRKDAQNAYAQGISDYFSGLEKSGGVLPIANGENFTQLKPVNMAEAGAVDLKRLSVEESARITGVPVSLLMDIKNSSYNSYSELFRQFKILTLDPRATQWDQEFTRKLLRSDELARYFIETVIDELMWSDPKDRTEYWMALFKMGALLPNEIRNYLNLPEVEGGDAAFIEGNNYIPLALAASGANVKDNGTTTARTDKAKLNGHAIVEN